MKPRGWLRISLLSVILLAILVHAKTPTCLHAQQTTPSDLEEALAGRFGAGGVSGIDFEAAVELGATWMRIPVDLGMMSFNDVDPFVSQAQEAGLLIDLIFQPGGQPGPEAEGSWSIPFTPEEFVEEMMRFVERYDGDGVDDMPGLRYPIRHCEIFNEFNPQVYGITYEEYAEYYRLAYEALKDNCPDWQVAPSSFVGVGPETQDFLQFLVEEGLEFDFLSYHAYCEGLNAGELMFILASLGIEDTPVWVTESQFGGGWERLPLSEEEVAASMARSYIYAFAMGIDKVQPSELRAQPFFNDGLKWSCLIDEYGNKRASYYVYLDLIRKLDRFTEVEVLSLGSTTQDPLTGHVEITGVYAFKFIVDGKPIYVVWGEEGASLPEEIRRLGLGLTPSLTNLSTVKVNPTPMFIEPYCEAEATPEVEVSPSESLTLEELLNILRASYALSEGSPGFREEADLNGDGKVNIIDLAILASRLTPSFTEEEGEELRSDITPGIGPGEPPPEVPPGADGPWNHRILIATSNDGLTWSKTYHVLAEQASVPDVIVDHEGRVRVYYVDYYNGGISVAISEDLSNWVYVKVKGINASWVDPDVVILPDGRYRLYASYMPLEGPQDKIISATSDDGIHFVVEGGVRYQEEGFTLTDPDTVYVDGQWIMYACKLTEPMPKLIRLVSNDGLTFVKESEMDFEGTVPCIILVENGYRLYCHLHDCTAILCWFSSDCRNWSGRTVVLEPGQPGTLDEFGVADPAVVELPDGSYLMIYKSWITQPFIGGVEGP